MNIQLASLTENLTAARAEAEASENKARQKQEKLLEEEKKNEALTGDNAGKSLSFCERNLTYLAHKSVRISLSR